MNDPIDSSRLRSLYLRFFTERGHAAIAGAPLLPDGDPSVLFTSAGMHPLVPYLLGQPHPAGSRLVGVQGCVRTGDIEEVGDDAHLTYFEMLGNWSLGDYGKRESIGWTFEFLTSPQWLGVDLQRLWVTVFAGGLGVPRDEEAAARWRELGVPAERIVFLSAEHNWWATGPQGPCGPDTEVFFDTTGLPCGERCGPGRCGCDRFVEIWNNVFMTFDRRDGELQRLPQPNIDTGMGLERTVAVLAGHGDVYRIDPLARQLAIVRDVAGCGDDPSVVRSLRIVTDHLRAAIFILNDPRRPVPGNQGAGYVLRRLIRRAIRHGTGLGLTGSGWATVMRRFVEDDPPHVLAALVEETERFERVRGKGERLLRRELERGTPRLSGEVAFVLYERYGFPLEFTRELCAEHGVGVDEDDFRRRFDHHRQRSRGERARSGLADDSAQGVRLHTATHLLHAALRHVLGDHVEQRGSNITRERLRFDFSHGSAMTPAQLERTRAWVQAAIDDDLPVIRDVTDPDRARADGALGLFTDRYDDRVSVYSIGDRSLEVCAGPHVDRTGELGRFRIVKEGSSGAGVRRIRAVLED